MRVVAGVVSAVALASCGGQTTARPAESACRQGAPLLRQARASLERGQLGRALLLSEEVDRSCFAQVGREVRERALVGLRVEPAARAAYHRRSRASLIVEDLAAVGDFGAKMRRATAALRSSQAALDRASTAMLATGPLRGEARAAVMRGLIAADAGRYRAARAALAKAIDRSPHPTALLVLAEVEAAAKRPVEAARLVARALVGAEWQAQRRAELTRLEHHRSRIGAMVVSPRDRYLALGGDAEVVQVIDLESGELAHVLAGHTGSVMSAAFSPGERMLATGSYDGTVRVWELTGGSTMLELAAPSEHRVHAVAFHPDGEQLIATSSRGRELVGTLRIWNLTSGTLRREIEKIGVVLGPVIEGDQVFAGTPQQIEAWSLSSGERRWSRSMEAAALALAPDGRLVVGTRDWSSGRPSSLLVWLDPATGAEKTRKAYPKLQGLGPLTFFDDSTVVGVKGYKLTRLDLESGEATELERGGAWGPGGRTAVMLASDWSSESFRVLDGNTGKEREVVGLAGERVLAAAFHPRLPIVVSTGTRARLWTLGGSVADCGPAGAAVFSPDGSRLAIGAGEAPLRVVDGRSCRELQVIDGARFPLAFSPDGAGVLVADSGYPPQLRVHDVETGAVIRELGKHRCDAAHYDESGERIVLIRNGTIAIINAASGERLLGNYAGFPADIALVGPDRALTAKGDTLAAIDLGDKEAKPAPLFSRKEKRYRRLAISPGGHLAALTDEDGLIDVVDVKAARLLASMGPFPRGEATSVAFSPDGSRLAIATGDSIEMWTPDGRRLGALVPRSAGGWLAVAGDRVEGVPLSIGAPSRFRWRIGGLALPGYAGWSRAHRAGASRQLGPEASR